MEQENTKKDQSLWAWVTELLKDERGNPNIKPLVALIGSLSLISPFLIGCFTVLHPNMDSRLIDAILIITLTAMGGDTVDKFSLKKS